MYNNEIHIITCDENGTLEQVDATQGRTGPGDERAIAS